MIIIDDAREHLSGEGAELVYELSRLFTLIDNIQFVKLSKEIARKDNALFLEWLDKLDSLVEINKQMAKLIKEFEERAKQKEQNKDDSGRYGKN